MLIPTQAGVLLMRDERDLDTAFSARAVLVPAEHASGPGHPQLHLFAR
jgi:hypothetical protein